MCFHQKTIKPSISLGAVLTMSPSDYTANPTSTSTDHFQCQ